jgi:ADP-ribose pyrophosphatase YjhB (NUDIX family)
VTNDAELVRWTYVAAYALCLDDADRVLLCRVGPGYESTGKWTLPGGGLEFGERPENAVIRELAEETGLLGEIDRLAFVDSGTGPAGAEREVRYGPYHAIRLVYRVSVTGGELRNELDGSTDTAGWFSLESTAQLPLVDLARAGVEYLDGK